MQTELFYRIAFTLIPGLGSINHRRLLSHYTKVEDIFQENPTALKTLFGNKLQTINAIKNKTVFATAEKELHFIEKYKIQTLFFQDENYPHRLRHSECNDTPILLYYKGNADLNNTKVLSVVGTRKSTNYGKVIIEQLMEKLAAENILIVSGLAYGIDTLAHKASVQHNLPTVGVLAHGLDYIYPQQNKELAKQMVQNGGLITEHISGSKAVPGVFPRRNRIIAALSDATLVIEASKKGGALITAEIANSYNREVFAVPGNLNETYSEGCNFLIKANKANLFQSVEDLHYHLNWENKKQPKVTQQKLFPDFTKPEANIYAEIEKNNPCSLEHLCDTTQISQSEIVGILLGLELKGAIHSLPGRMYGLA